MLQRAVGSCCPKFETGQSLIYEQTDATTPNNVGPTMLGVVASVCTLLKITITKVVETSIESDCQKLFRTTLTRTIMVYLLINRLLGSKLSQPQ